MTTIPTHTTIVEFVDHLPAGAHGHNIDYDIIVAALRQRPHTWAIVLREPAGSGHDRAYRNFERKKVPFMRRGCETRVRTIDGERRIYARWPNGQEAL